MSYKGFIRYNIIFFNIIRQASFYPLGVPSASYNLVILRVVAFSLEVIQKMPNIKYMKIILGFENQHTVHSQNMIKLVYNYIKS